MSTRLWKIEPLGKPSLAHAADAVEIVGGEAVRRVTLSQLDALAYATYCKIKADDGHGPTAELLAHKLDIPVEESAAALRRLVAVGLLEAPEQKTLQ